MIEIGLKRTIFALIVALFIQNAVAQEKELLIIGTMHEVPSIVSHSYRPLLKYAKKYKPEAIFVSARYLSARYLSPGSPRAGCFYRHQLRESSCHFF